MRQEQPLAFVVLLLGSPFLEWRMHTRTHTQAHKVFRYWPQKCSLAEEQKVLGRLRGFVNGEFPDMLCQIFITSLWSPQLCSAYSLMLLLLRSLFSTQTFCYQKRADVSVLLEATSSGLGPPLQSPGGASGQTALPPKSWFSIYKHVCSSNHEAVSAKQTPESLTRVTKGQNGGGCSPFAKTKGAWGQGGWAAWGAKKELGWLLKEKYTERRLKVCFKEAEGDVM